MRCCKAGIRIGMQVFVKGKAAIAVLACCLCLLPAPQAQARHRKEPVVPRIIYVPHDNRPISDKQTAEVAEKLGYEVVVPPDEILGSRDNLGQPERLWQWLETNAEGAEAAVISSDSLLYGSLVGSRKHNYSEKEIIARADRFRQFRTEHPELQLYVFSSIMRTPRSGEASGHMEPAYYDSYGSDIFRYTELSDKQEVEGLTRREQKEYAFLQELIPKKDLKDWLERRAKNFAANQRLIELTRQNTFDYLALGRDDNAPYSQTHMESRHLAKAGRDLDAGRFQALAGIDEIGVLMLARAVNEMRQETPLVFVRYNWGKGERTVPAYSDEPIKRSVESAVAAAGGKMAASPAGADFVLAVNTNPNGRTYEANDRANNGTPREGTAYFTDIVSDYVAKGYPVGIADIAYANGADNALLEALKERGLLFKLRAYAGWNTPTNSTGFVLGIGMLAPYMTEKSVGELLLTRYLDDWAYQANIRNTVARQLTWLRGDGVYGSLGTKKTYVSNRASQLLQRFVQRNLPPYKSLEEIYVTFPWNRMFESDVRHGAAFDTASYFKH